MSWKVCVLLIITVSALSVTSTTLGKIFTHERGQDAVSQEIKKTPRLDDNDVLMDYVKRAIDEFKDTIESQTGFYLLDFIFEIIKTFCVFLLTLMVPVEENFLTNATYVHHINNNDF